MMMQTALDGAVVTMKDQLFQGRWTGMPMRQVTRQRDQMEFQLHLASYCTENPLASSLGIKFAGTFIVV